MLFHYIASSATEQVIEDDIDAKDVAEVLMYLGQNGLRPVSVRALEKASTPGFFLFRQRVTMTDQIFISKYLALMLKIGTGLLEAMNILIADFRKPAVKNILVSIRSALEQGAPFFSTFAKHPEIFSPVYINLVRAGEASGNLEGTFEQLTKTLTKQKDLHDQIRGALIYPMMLLAGSVGILVFIVVFALPKISKVFTEGGFEPPLFSRIVFSVGAFLNQEGWIILILLAALGTFLFVAPRTSGSIKKFFITITDEIPVIRDVVKKVALQRFADVFASLIRAGLPVTDALEITAQATGNSELREVLYRISREGIAKGLTIGEAFRREPYFPLTVISLIAISEKAGHLSEVLDTLSDFYIKEIDSAIKTLVSFLEPVLLLGIGAVIAVIALAVIIPIYQLTTQF